MFSGKKLLSDKNLLLRKVLPFCGVGLAAGVCSGLLGAGGGAVIAAGLGQIFHGEDRRAVFATTLTTMLPLSFFSALRYGEAAISEEAMIPLILCSIAGGVAGGFFLYRLPAFWLSRVFAGVLLFSGILLVAL